MATTLAPVDSREVVRCDRCRLVQFRTANHLCRRCHVSLDADEPEPAPVAAAAGAPAPRNGHAHLQVALAIRSLRQRGGLSQRQLALRMQVPRTYVSKIENEKATPTLSSLERLARALGVRVPDLLCCSPVTPDPQTRELLEDDFIAQLAPYVSKLDALQRSTLMTQLRDLATRPRRQA